MRVGKKDAEVIIEKADDVSAKEKELMQIWKETEEEPKVTTFRMYEETINQVKQYARENFKVIPEYVVMDHIIQEGMQAVQSK